MSTLYNISIWFYLIAIQIASLFNPKAKLWIKGREDLFKKLKKSLANRENIVWFHCASLGEFEQGKPIIKAYKLTHPTHQILLTFFLLQDMKLEKILLWQIGSSTFLVIRNQMLKNLSVL